MELITDVSRGAWLLARAGTFGTVGGTAGTGFEASARILHPVSADREDRSTVDEREDHPVLESGRWRWSDVASRTGGIVHPLVQWRSLTGRTDESDLVFEDGWRVHPPEEGWFEPILLAALTEHLAASTSTSDDLVAAIWSGWSELSGGRRLLSGGRAPIRRLRRRSRRCAATRSRSRRSTTMRRPRSVLPSRSNASTGRTASASSSR
ncbi:hypothetical protein [Curtobacterium sp. 24E2]|nr:hypothetical protein JN350_09735 [Curtobacterium sp. 24E2]